MTRSQWVADYLIKYRATEGITQAALAKIIGATQSQVCLWETGRHAPSELRIQQITEILKDVGMAG